MNILKLALVDNENNILKEESKFLPSSDSKDFIESLVYLCNKLDISPPVWTFVQERELNKKNEVIIKDTEYGKNYLKVSILPNNT